MDYPINYTHVIIFILIIFAFNFFFSKEPMANFGEIGQILSPNQVDLTVQTPAGCPQCTPCICPTCPTAPDVVTTGNNFQRDYRVINDPLYPPEQRSDSNYTSSYNYSYGNQYGGYFRYPTRGYPPPYQLKGYLVDKSDPKNILSLFGRPKYSGSTEFEYYVSKRDINNNDLKIDIPNKREIFDKDELTLSNGLFDGTYNYVGLKMEDLVQPPIY